MANAPTYRNYWPTAANQWNALKIDPKRSLELKNFVRKALAGKKRYQVVESRTGVPWYWVAIAAERESGQNFSRSLAQGDRWDRRSIRIPRNRGPFASWEDAAYDALVTLKRLDKVKDWRLEKQFYYLELYNGLGYHYRGLPSPYIWGATNQQRRGKYIADGVFSSTHWDTQLGCAAMLKALMDADPTVRPVRET